jgi:hydroxymethylpyrimidine pyrophosphatase-like HAD family hydrolase
MDFDGTLKPFNAPVSYADISALKELKELGATRVVATGRSVQGFARDWAPALDIDYLISSSGLATSRFGPEGPGEILRSYAFTAAEANLAINIAVDLKFGFFLSLPPPQTHIFYYSPPILDPPPCFQARVSQYGLADSLWDGSREGPFGLVLIMTFPEDAPLAESYYRSFAPELSFVKSSSPYGDPAMWLEIYPPGVGKGPAAAALAESLGLGPADAVALGNDYNDESLLKWAQYPFLVESAPQSMLDLFERRLPPPPQGPLARALAHFRAEMGPEKDGA